MLCYGVSFWVMKKLRNQTELLVGGSVNALNVSVNALNVTELFALK